MNTRLSLLSSLKLQICPNITWFISQSLIKIEGWQGSVTVVSSDMRQWNAPEQADILVKWP